MTIIDNKEIKEVIDRIKQEQQDKGLSETERLQDWEEKFAIQCEKVEWANEKLKENHERNKFLEDNNKNMLEFYRELLNKEKEEKNEKFFGKILEKLVKEKVKGETKEEDKEENIDMDIKIKKIVEDYVSLLKEQHKEEVEKIKSENKVKEYWFEEVGKLKIELEEKEKLINQLEEQNNSQLITQIEIKK